MDEYFSQAPGMKITDAQKDSNTIREHLIPPKVTGYLSRQMSDDNDKYRNYFWLMMIIFSFMFNFLSIIVLLNFQSGYQFAKRNKNKDIIRT